MLIPRKATRRRVRTPKSAAKRKRRPRYVCDEVLWSAMRLRIAFASPRFGVGSLLDLFESRISVADPFACFVDLSWVYRYGARNFLAPRHQLAFILHRLGAFDRKFPMMPEPEERVKHGLGFRRAHAAATHGVVEHAVAILPWPVVFAVGDVV